MTAFANINGETISEVLLHVPNVGPWWAEIVFEGAPDITGTVTLNLGELALRGTLRDIDGGTFAERRRAMLVAGGAGWATLLPAKHYHNDAGVRAQSIAEEAARLAGETIGSFSVDPVQVGIDYVREAGFASRALEDVINGAPWHVDYDGNTNVGERSTDRPNDSDYQVLDFEPKEKFAVLAVDDLTKIKVGSILSEGLDAEETVCELRIEVNAENVRVHAWTGGTLTERGRVARALRNFVQRTTDRKLFGKYRYRVVQMSGDRVELQAVRRAAGLPDILPVSMQPGVAGAHASLTGGSIVLVEFVEGDRTLPIVSAFAGKDTSGHEAQNLTFSIAVTLKLGSASASEGATLGTSHKQWADNHKHAYIDSIGTAGTPTPKLTTEPALAPGPAPTGLPITPDPAPDPSTKVFVE